MVKIIYTGVAAIFTISQKSHIQPQQLTTSSLFPPFFYAFSLLFIFAFSNFAFPYSGCYELSCVPKKHMLKSNPSTCRINLIDK